MSALIFAKEDWQYEPVSVTSRRSTTFMDDRDELSYSDSAEDVSLRKRTQSMSQRRQSVAENIDKYRGIRSLYEQRHMRIGRRKKIPILDILYTTAFLQCLIVVCITIIITYRKETEAFFLNTTDSFKSIFGLDEVTASHLLRTDNVYETLHDKFRVFFDLNHKYCDHFVYPEDIKVENQTGNHSIHNLIPTATLQFVNDDNSKMEYILNPMNYSILSSKSSEFIAQIQSSHRIHSLFEIESYSFTNDVRNLWRWSIDSVLHFSKGSNQMTSSLSLNYDRIGHDVSWWNKDSTAFMASVIASFGLCAFSIMALARFTYKYGFLWKWTLVKSLGFRVMLPISHCVSLLCGLMYLINLSNFADWNDLWELRLVLAVCALLSWTMLVFGISTQGTEYGALFRALRISVKPIVILIISLFPIAIGFILFGTMMFGVPDGQHKFTDPESTAKTLYAVWLGDEVLDTFYAAGVGNFIAELYMYSWGILFIAVIFNVGLAIVESNFFKTIPQLEHDEKSIAPSEKLDKSVRFTEDEQFADSDSESREGQMATEWKLDAPEEFKSEIYLLSPKRSDYVSPRNQKEDKTSIPLGMMLTRIPSSQEVPSTAPSTVITPFDDDQSLFSFGSDPAIRMQTSMNAADMVERKTKYAQQFVSHLRKTMLREMADRWIKKEIRSLLNQYAVDSHEDLDILQQEIVDRYDAHLGIVTRQTQQLLLAK